MSDGNFNWIANFIWGIADDVLRDVYVRGKYRDVILPMTVIRRLDAVLEPTKQAVLAMKQRLDAVGITNQDAALRQGCAEFGMRHPSAVQFCPTAAKVAPRQSILLSVRAPVGTLNMADQEYAIGRGLCAIAPNQDILNLEFAFCTIFACKGQLLMIPLAQLTMQ